MRTLERSCTRRRSAADRHKSQLLCNQSAVLQKKGPPRVRPPRETGGSGRRGGQFGPPYKRDYMPQAQQELARVVIRPRRPWPRHARAEDRNFGSSGRRAVGQKWVNICAVGQPWVNVFESLRARDEMTSDTSDDPSTPSDLLFYRRRRSAAR